MAAHDFIPADSDIQNPRFTGGRFKLKVEIPYAKRHLQTIPDD